MRSKITTAVIALALVGAFVAPASAAQAATATVSGTVSYHGATKAGFKVGWFAPSTQDYKSVSSRSDGTYTLPLPPVGTEYVLYSNLIVKEARQTRINKSYVGVYHGAGNTTDYAFQTLPEYTADGADDTFDFELAKPGSLVGTDSKLEGTYTLENLGGGVLKEAAAVKGKLSFSNLVPGQYRVSNRKYHFPVDVSDQILTVKEGTTTKFSPGALNGGKISGIVTGSNGKPIAGLSISATRVDGEDEYGNHSITDSKGRYTLRYLHGSSYDVHFGYTATFDTDRGHVERTSRVEGVTDEGTVTRNITLTTGGRIRGTLPESPTSDNHALYLFGPDGQPIGIEDYRRAGAFTYGSLPTGQYTMYFKNFASKRYGKWTVDVTAGKTVDLGTLTRTKTLRSLKGSVEGATKNTRIYVSAQSDSLPGAVGVRVDKSGRYEITGLIPGTYDVVVSREDYNETVESVAITRDRSKTLHVGTRYGKVVADVTFEGARVLDAEIYLSGTTGKYSPSMLLGVVEVGTFRAWAPTGTYDKVVGLHVLNTFQANSPYWVSFSDDSLPITVESGPTIDLGELTLEAHPSLTLG